MKNLLIFTENKFLANFEELTKIQIDNSLSLGWKPADIILATNFDYEYKGVKSTIVENHKYWDQSRSTKIMAINELFAKGKINDLYWFHDHDAFQLYPMEVKLEKEAGFTNHGYSNHWNAGSFFFTPKAKDIFIWIYEYMVKRNLNEQSALTYMWENNINGVNDRYEIMNQTYNIGIYHIDKLVKMSEKPIKVAHFHPHKRRHLDLFKSRNLLPERLITIFNQYGIK